MTEGENDEWYPVLGGKRRRRNVHPQPGGTRHYAPEEPIIKRVSFAQVGQLYEIHDSGMDEFTFDNKDPNGEPRVRQNRTPGRQISEEGIKAHLLRSAAAQAKAHHRAFRWISGETVALPPARILIYQGRRTYIDPEPIHDDDVPFVLKIPKTHADYVNYTTKSLAVWDQHAVYFHSINPETGDWRLNKYERIKQNAAIKYFIQSDAEYHHIGCVPDELSGRASPTCTHAGTVTSKRIIQWIVDTGAAVHCIGRREAHEAHYRKKRVQCPLTLSGVGGPVNADQVAVIRQCGALGIPIEPYIIQDGMNLLSGQGLCDIGKLNFMWLGSLGFHHIFFYLTAKP